jgi:hypothetical protein
VQKYWSDRIHHVRMPGTRKRRILHRVGLVGSVGLVAVLCLSSSMLAAIVGAATVLVVTLDMIALGRKPAPPFGSDPTPDKLTVDLSRRP